MRNFVKPVTTALLAGLAVTAAAARPAPDYAAYADFKIPPLPPEKALETFELEEGFRIEIVAHEPMIENPVAMDIDADGRLWVVEMVSYMPVHDMEDWETAMREQVPQGRLVVLEDTTGDGRMDASRVFFDELILPRAVKVLDDGVLIGEPPYVWLIRDTTGDGRGDSREVVYNNYGDPLGDNVEHMPNGLMWGIDNWLHSSHSGVHSLRRAAGGGWTNRPFHRLGQWGMTQDDWGRLFSTHNSHPLQTHFVPHGYGARHPDFSVRAGKNRRIAPREVWPAHPTGVNRGYRDNVLREDGTLRTATATCGPVIYRGHQFGPDYVGNAFVPEPAGNLIKRLLLDGGPEEIEVAARNPYEGREFLTSTDERFRPVNLYNAPDGTLYVLDMYRGLFQHARFLTDYLRDYAVAHDLHQPQTRFGRIYRIVRDDRPHDPRNPRLSGQSPRELAQGLDHENGLLRDISQQLLVQRSPAEAVPLLREMAADPDRSPQTRLHALWTLEGFDRAVAPPELVVATALRALDDPHARVRAAAVRILEPALAGGDGAVLERLDQMARAETAPFVQLQLLASLGESPLPDALRPMARILDRNTGEAVFREMALTGVYRRELDFADVLRRAPAWSEDSDNRRREFLETLAKAAEGREEEKPANLDGEQLLVFERGRLQYRTCMACHGERGEGLEGVATPLDGSEWVLGRAEPLIRIVLQGFEGEDETVPGVMPPHAFLPDEEMAALLTYIRNAWSNRAPAVTPAEVDRVRGDVPDGHILWSADQLRALLEN